MPTGIPAAFVIRRTRKPVGWIINPHSSMPVYPASFIFCRMYSACSLKKRRMIHFLETQGLKVS